MKFYTYIILGLLFGFSVSAQEADKIYSKANNHYNNKEFDLAIKDYHTVEKEYKYSSDLYYNMGNAYFRLSDYANAMLYYERGLKISPNDTKLIHNKKVCKSRLKGDVFEIKDFFLIKYWKDISNIFLPKIWIFITITLTLITSIFFTIYYFNEKYKVLLFYIFLIFATLNIVSIFAGFTRQQNLNSNKYAIIFCESCKAKKMPEEKSEESLILYKGQKIKIINHQEEWIFMRQEDGKEAWCKKSWIKII